LEHLLMVSLFFRLELGNHSSLLFYNRTYRIPSPSEKPRKTSLTFPCFE
jgi:hypothetical protein